MGRFVEADGLGADVEAEDAAGAGAFVSLIFRCSYFDSTLSLPTAATSSDRSIRRNGRKEEKGNKEVSSTPAHTSLKSLAVQ
jgi:hypothetical protein